MSSQRSRKHLDVDGGIVEGAVARGLGLCSKAAPVLVALLMVVSSVTFASYSASASDDVDVGKEVVVVPEDRTATFILPDWNGKMWDWSSMANETGYVRVIVAANGPSSALGLDTVIAGEGIIPDYRYSVGFEGFSAALRLDSLQSFMSRNQGLQIFPDFPVNATALDNIVKIGADQIWSRTAPSGWAATGHGITVAVIDTGIDYMHPDLGGGIGPTFKVKGGYDFYNRDSDPMDDNGHGTHVAGVIAADGGIQGVAPDASLLAYKALGADGNGMMSDVVSAIGRALDPNEDGDKSDHADVISMSLGGTGDAGDPVSLAVRDAVNQGAVVVVAAGNEGPSMGTVASPGIAPEAVTVGAVDSSGKLASFSSRGTTPSTLIKPEISAPGVDIYSTVPFGGAPLSSPTGYMILSGTSMATPHVSGAAALLIELHPDWTPQQVKSALVSGSSHLDESLWMAGAGEVWLPGSADADLFADEALVSYGYSGGVAVPIEISNMGGSSTLAISSRDFSMLGANATRVAPEWTNMSSVSPTSLSLPTGASGSINLVVSSPAASAPEGYYEGIISVAHGSSSLPVPFGFVVLSRLNVHVLDTQGREVVDSFGGVVAYSVPGESVVVTARSDTKPSPPASFLLPSGTYNVHALGHELIYTYSDPYILSGTFQLARAEVKDVYLSMSGARQMILDLETDAGIPIYVKDYRVYFRHEGARNVSFHLIGSDYFTVGAELPTLARSRTVYVSDTSETIGISIAGFSYSPEMWSFMSRNSNHWFEGISSNSAGFYIESSADLQYLLAWEFPGVDASSSLSLAPVEGEYSIYKTKYDIPGQITQPWCDWNTRVPQGAESSFYIRRDTQSPINPFFSGMTRTTIVQGVFSDLYYPGGLFNGFSEAQYYSADYSHVLRAATASEIYLPDRNFLTALPGVNATSRLGTGPYYPAVRTANSDSSLVLFHPLLRDQSGARLVGVDVPRMELFLNGGQFGIYQLSEYRARPDAKRIVSLPDPGFYVAKIDYQSGLQVTDNVNIELGFSVPGADIDPPVITGMAMPQRFVPGELVPVRFTATDSGSAVTASISWRSSEFASWSSLPVTTYGPGDFGVSIQTSTSNALIDLMINIRDATGNYIKYTASNAALAQVPVVFELSASSTSVDYRNSNVTVTLTGRLVDSLGNPLHSAAAVPLELTVGTTKVGMIMDEYVASSSHTHNGTVRFDWTLNPYHLFSGPEQDVNVSVDFDLGIYQPITRNFTLHSVPYFNLPPEITLDSPTNGSLVASGAMINLTITNTSPVTAYYSLDGSSSVTLTSPWDISTAAWSDGTHLLRVWATDEDMVTNSSVFEFTVDALFPSVSINSPENNSRAPANWTMSISASDARLETVGYSVDGSARIDVVAPYQVDMTGWAFGMHSVWVEAIDAVGHSSKTYAQFEIVDSSVSVDFTAPGSGSVVKPGTNVILQVLGFGTITCSYSVGGVSHLLSAPYVISTDGWADGQYIITANASNDLGGSFESTLTIVIDGTPPRITVESPTERYVDKSSQIRLRIDDANFEMAQWVLWGTTYMTVSQTPMIFLDSAPNDGEFNISVTASDKAGNVGYNRFNFTLDSMPPSISVTGLSASGGVAHGGKLIVTATDMLLSTVTVSLDESAPSAVGVPYELDTTLMALGEHTLKVVASDKSGKSSNKTVVFYVDGSPPAVALIPVEGFVPGSSIEILANATDDFRVAGVVLHMTTVSGSTHSLQMQRQGLLFNATVAADILWDGMSIYASATDEVGHAADSAALTLRAVGSSADEGPGSDSLGSSIWSFMSSIPLIVWAVIVAAIASAVVFYVLKRRRVRRYDDLTPYEDDGHMEALSEPPTEELPVPPPIAVPMEELEVQTPTAIELDNGPMEPTQAEPEPEVEMPEEQADLLDAIPDVVLEPLTEGQSEPEPDVDYGDLIERELIAGAQKRSVYREDPRTAATMDKELESLLQILDEMDKQSKKERIDSTRSEDRQDSV